MNSEAIVLISTIITSIFVVINSVILYKISKKSKTFDIGFEEIHELNKKMHDRLVDAEITIKENKYLPSKTITRLLYNASRLLKYDETILNDVNRLTNGWNLMLDLKERGDIDSGRLSRARAEITDLIKRIKSKVDKLQTEA